MSIAHFSSTTFQTFEISEVITLSGTTGDPNQAIDFETSPTNAQAWWDFKTDGRIWKEGLSAGFFQSGTEWNSNYPDAPGRDYWIRATANADSAPNLGQTLNTWHVLYGTGQSDRRWGWEEAAIGSYLGSIKVEIATDSGGSNIVATGYYEGRADVEV